MIFLSSRHEALLRFRLHTGTCLTVITIRIIAAEPTGTQNLCWLLLSIAATGEHNGNCATSRA